MTWVMSNLVTVRLEIVLVSMQDRCRVCATCTIGSEIILDAPMVLLGDEAQVEYLVSVHLDILLILTQDRCIVCVGRTVGSDIVLDAPDGAPRRRGSCGISLLPVWRQC